MTPPIFVRSHCRWVTSGRSLCLRRRNGGKKAGCQKTCQPQWKVFPTEPRRNSSNPEEAFFISPRLETSNFDIQEVILVCFHFFETVPSPFLPCLRVEVPRWSHRQTRRCFRRKRLIIYFEVACSEEAVP